MTTRLTSAIKVEIAENANYSGTDGSLSGDEILALHAKVNEGLATTNGDAGDCEISTRHLAILLNEYIHDL